MNCASVIQKVALVMMFVLVSFPSSGIGTCAQVFASPIRHQLSSENFLVAERDFARKRDSYYRKYGKKSPLVWDVFSSWAAKIPADRNLLFRGMVLRDISTLKNILENGLDPRYSHYTNPHGNPIIFFSDSPSYAIRYAFFQADVSTSKKKDPKFNYIDRGLRVLLEFDRSRIKTKTHSTGFTSDSSVNPEAITRIFIFDRAAPYDFPFHVFTRTELMDLIGFLTAPE